jgi:hypothetical protein
MVAFWAICGHSKTEGLDLTGVETRLPVSKHLNPLVHHNAHGL